MLAYVFMSIFQFTPQTLQISEILLDSVKQWSVSGIMALRRSSERQIISEIAYIPIITVERMPLLDGKGQNSDQLTEDVYRPKDIAPSVLRPMVVTCRIFLS
jgi:hypothetical protein